MTTSPVGPAERGARAAWTRLAEPADPRVTALFAEYGPVDALALAVRAEAGILPLFAERAARFQVDPDPARHLEIARALGAQLLCPGDPEWPDGIDGHPTPPICLWVRGDPDLATMARRSVAVVGARSSTAYGESVASSLGSGLAERGWTVISGAAFGIDVAAHRGAMSAGGLTVAVLASGVDRPYPTAHARVIERMAEVGAVISEVAPGSVPTRQRFLLRNRIIATMGRGVVVVEAGLRSGSLNTARTAAEQGRPVGVVPGPVTSMMSAGCHQSSREGWAVIVTDVEEVIDLVGDVGADSAPRRSADPLPCDRLDPLDAQVLSFVPVRKTWTTTDIALAASVPAVAAAAALGRLEVEGLVRREAGCWRKAPQPTTREER